MWVLVVHFNPRSCPATVSYGTLIRYPQRLVIPLVFIRSYVIHAISTSDLKTDVRGRRSVSHSLSGLLSAPRALRCVVPTLAPRIAIGVDENFGWDSLKPTRYAIDIPPRFSHIVDSCEFFEMTTKLNQCTHRGLCNSRGRLCVALGGRAYALTGRFSPCYEICKHIKN